MSGSSNPPSLREFEASAGGAHHIGTEQSEYSEILRNLRGLLDPNDRILHLSATLWHPEMNIIRDELKGAVTATHLLEDELRQLREGRVAGKVRMTDFTRKRPSA